MSDKSDEVAIKVANVSKDFKFDSNRAGTLKSMFTGMFKGSGTKSAKKQHALKNVSFEVKKGEFFGIVGRNGSGKSTLLKMMAGIYQPTKGDIDVNGRLVPFIELGVGFNPELTGRENVYLNGALLNFSEKEIDKFYNEVVEFAELEEFMDKQLKNYSSGMQVRLAFSMAIRAKADILLIDEVLAVGDADFQRKCYRYFKQLKKNKKTVVFVSHDMDAIREFCDRALLIEDSQVVKEGSVDDVTYVHQRIMFSAGEISSMPNEVKKKEDYSKSEEAEIVSVQTVDKSMKKKLAFHVSEDVNVRFVIKIKKKLERPRFAFSIRNQDNQTVMATNTKVLDIELGTLEPGLKELTFSVQNIFTNDTYTIYATLFDDNFNAIYSRVKHVTDFNCFGRSKSVAVSLAHPSIERIE